jgi:porphobilinogen deaminase
LLKLDGLVAKPDGSEILRHSLFGRSSDPEALGSALASRLIERGAITFLHADG